MGLTPQHFLRVAREHTYALQNPNFPSKDSENPPDWMAARARLGIMPTTVLGLSVKEESAPVPGGKDLGKRKKQLRELEIVE